ncbi:hypothetical protein [Glycomyces paridis]|uniref:Uncharacterized protein n=1 Tax=Glycomyces paridis TaxID=2126555 RepID=A0A4V6T676_9ACTN|nr:hypothetical protein [Glycomyces paridis]THV23506.1 hypothetical protein E9998_23200 [Glycomyces paridis]
MPNSSYLCSTGLRTLYPSTTDAAFDAATGVVAFDVRAVPLLWLAMFRPGDIAEQSITVETDASAVVAEFDFARGEFVEVVPDPEAGASETVEAAAPLAEKGAALAGLDAAVPVLNRLFAAEGALDEHAALLRRAVERSPGAYLTIELDEIEALWEPGTFAPALREALACLDGEAGPGRERLLELTGLRTGRPFPPARLLLDGIDAEDDDHWNLVRLLGASFGADVPWETA